MSSKAQGLGEGGAGTAMAGMSSSQARGALSSPQSAHVAHL